MRACKGSRSTGGALTRICLSVLIAVVRALTALSRATLSCRIISTAPSAVLGVAGGLPREHRAGGRLSVDSVRLARGSTQTPIDSIHFHDPMTRAVDRTGQADAVAAGPFNADGLDATIRLGPGEQRSIPLESAPNEWAPRRMPRLSIATATCMCLWVSTPTITVCALCRSATAPSGGGLMKAPRRGLR